MLTINTNANEISQPQFIPAGSLVTVSPDAGASVLVEYTLDSGPTVFSGLATWLAWRKGTVLAETSDLLNEPAYVRLRPTDGAAALSFDLSPNWQQKSQFTTDWGGPGGDLSLASWAYAQTFQLVSATRDANGAITTATIKWPDGTNGVFTTDIASTAFPGAIDAWHATYLGTTTKTVTQPAVTRDANGAVTVQPAITIS